MILAVFILAVILIGYFAPRWVVARAPTTLGVALGVVAALALGVGVIWLGAQAAAAAGLEEARSAFDRGFNAWKIMLFLAPASAIHMRRQMAKAES